MEIRKKLLWSHTSFLTQPNTRANATKVTDSYHAFLVTV